MLREEWRQINSWGCDRAAEWSRKSYEKGYFNGLHWGECFYYTFSYLLIAVLKNYLLADRIINGHCPASVVVFKYKTPLPFPGIYGNIYLNIFIEELAQKRQIATEEIVIEGIPAVSYTTPVPQVSFKSHIKDWADQWYVNFMKPVKPVTILTKGSLMHLAPLVQALREKGESIGLYSDVFQWAMFRFAVKNRTPYYTRRCFVAAKDAGEEAFIAEASKKILNALKEFSSQKGFIYEGVDFGGFIQKTIFGDMKSYFKMAAMEAKKYEKVLQACAPKAWLIDEDVSPGGSYFAAYHKMRRLQLFCVSHAHYPVDFSVSEENRKYGPSATLVNSEYERSIYGARGWNKDKMFVTGTPRYDRLIRMYRKNQTKRPAKLFNLLWCGSSLWMSQPDFPAYLGYHVTNWGESQIPSLETTLEAIKGLPIRLVIKPHMREDEREWKSFIKKREIENEVVVKKQSEDFFKLLLRSDALIMSYWSTSVVEARICNKPVLLVDPLNILQDSAPFIREGYCAIHRDAASLASSLAGLVKDQADRKKVYWNPTEEKDSYYFGENDFQNVSRGADFINNALHGSKRISFETIYQKKGAPAEYVKNQSF